jgi:DNA-binding response OmpR family regulator
MPTMSSRPLRILVVDDDPAMVGAITALVGTEGHQVITAYDGLTAVKRFRDEHPDLVLLDLAMPGPDGFNVAGQMRAVGQAPILVVSGESGEAAKVRALGLGADDYLTKPFGKAELLARIAAVMRRVDRAAGDIVPHLQLARAGWPAETDPDLLWLKPHLARLRAKVEAAGGPAIVAVRGVGYRIMVVSEVTRA